MSDLRPSLRFYFCLRDPTRPGFQNPLAEGMWEGIVHSNSAWSIPSFS